MVNHALVQHYRSGADWIGEHADKTVDVVRGSAIVNVSLGARRTMTLRMKKDRQPSSEERRPAQRIPLPHNSMFVLGLATNRAWQHGIAADKRAAGERDAGELACGGERISVTFRSIGTWVSADGARIWGQGARGKTVGEAGAVVSGGAEGEALLAAFGRENAEREFDWEGVYGAGSDVLHFSSA